MPEPWWVKPPVEEKPRGPAELLGAGLEKVSEGFDWINKNIDQPFASTIWYGLSKVLPGTQPGEQEWDALARKGIMPWDQRAVDVYRSLPEPEFDAFGRKWSVPVKGITEMADPLWWLPWNRAIGLAGKAALPALKMTPGLATIGRSVSSSKLGRGVAKAFEEAPQSIVRNLPLNADDALLAARPLYKTDDEFLRALAGNTLADGTERVIAERGPYTKRAFDYMIEHRDKLDWDTYLKLSEGGVPLSEIAQLAGQELKTPIAGSLGVKEIGRGPVSQFFGDIYSWWRSSVLYTPSFVLQNLVEDPIRVFNATGRSFYRTLSHSADAALGRPAALRSQSISFTNRLRGDRSVVDTVRRLSSEIDTTNANIIMAKRAGKTALAERLVARVGNMQAELAQVKKLGMAGGGGEGATLATLGRSRPFQASFEAGAQALHAPKAWGTTGANLTSAPAASMDAWMLNAVFDAAKPQYLKALSKGRPALAAYSKALDGVLTPELQARLMGEGMSEAAVKDAFAAIRNSGPKAGPKLAEIMGDAAYHELGDNTGKVVPSVVWNKHIDKVRLEADRAAITGDYAKIDETIASMKDDFFVHSKEFMREYTAARAETLEQVLKDLPAEAQAEIRHAAQGITDYLGPEHEKQVMDMVRAEFPEQVPFYEAMFANREQTQLIANLHAAQLAQLYGADKEAYRALLTKSNAVKPALDRKYFNVRDGLLLDVRRLASKRKIETGGITPPISRELAPTLGATSPNLTRAFGTTPDKVYEFRYVVRDLDDLIPSHTDALARNPRYPSELQPRERARAASRVQIDNMAQNLVPEALLEDVRTLDRGPMIIGPDNIVESGNGRVLALRRAREIAPDNFETYKAKLAEVIPQYGLTPESIQGMKSPVLVRERITPVNRASFAAEANAPSVLTMSTSERALQDTGRISEAALGRLQILETETIDQAIRSPRNLPLVREFIGNLPANERAALMDAKANLSLEGLQRIKAAVFAKVFPGEAGQRLTVALFESLDPTVKIIEQAIFDALPALAKSEGLAMTGQRAGALAIGDDLAKSVDTLARLKASGVKVSGYLSQIPLQGRELSTAQERLLAFLDEYGRSRKTLREFLRDYSEAVMASSDPRQLTMLTGGTPTKEEILERLFKRQQVESQGPLFGSIEERARILGEPAPTPIRPQLAEPRVGEPVAAQYAAPEARPPAAPPVEPPPPALQEPFIGANPETWNGFIDKWSPVFPEIGQLLVKDGPNRSSLWGAYKAATAAHFKRRIEELAKELNVEAFLGKGVDNEQFYNRVSQEIDQLGQQARKYASLTPGASTKELKGQLAILAEKHGAAGVEHAAIDAKATRLAEQKAYATAGNYAVNTNLDEFMRNIFPFWYFPSRSIPYYLKTFANKPYELAALHRATNIGRTEDAPQAMLGYIPVPGIPGAYVNPFRPWMGYQLMGREPFAGAGEPGPEQVKTALSMLGFSLGPQVSIPFSVANKVSESFGGPQLERGEARPLLPQEQYLQALTGAMGAQAGMGVQSPTSELIYGESVPDWMERNVDKELAARGISPRLATKAERAAAAQEVNKRRLLTVLLPGYRYRAPEELQRYKDIAGTLEAVGVDKERQQELRGMGLSPFSDLNRRQKRAIFESHPEWESWTGVMPAFMKPGERESWQTTQDFYKRWYSLRGRLDKEQEADSAMVASGNMPKWVWKERYQERASLRANSWEQLQADYPNAVVTQEQHTEYAKKFGRNVAPIPQEDEVLNEYYKIKPQPGIGGTMDWGRFFQERDDFLARQDPDIRHYIEAETSKAAEPDRPGYDSVEAEYIKSQPYLRAYQGVRDSLIRRYPGVKIWWDEYLKLNTKSPRAAATFRQRAPTLQWLDSQERQIKERMRQSVPGLNQALTDWLGYQEPS